MPPIWPLIGTPSFHETPEASNRLPQEPRSPLYYLHGRPAHYGPITRHVSPTHTVAALDLLEALGLVVNYKKSHLTPTHELVFLGFKVDANRRELILPSEKVQGIVAEARSLINKGKSLARHLAKLIGKLSAAISAVHPAPLHYRSLQQLKHQALAAQGYDGEISVSREALQDLQWWVDHLHEWNRRSLEEPQASLIIETDASKTGWGAFCQGTATGGCWSQAESRCHINCLELIAALYGVNAFASTRHTATS